MLTKEILETMPKSGGSGGESNDDEACAALLAFASADDDQKQRRPAPKPSKSSRVKKRHRNHAAVAAAEEEEEEEEEAYTEVLPIQKIASIMKRAVPSGACISKGAKQAVQACVCEFICFLTSEACDGKEDDQSIESEDVLKAFSHLGFDQYSHACLAYIQQYRRHLASTEPPRKAPRKPASPPAPPSVPRQDVAEKPGKAEKTVTSTTSSSSTTSCMTPFNHPAPTNVHALKSLRAASIEVATSLVYAWSRPILESALFLAGSPSASVCTPVSAPTPFPSPMMSPAAMSPMFMAHMGMAMKGMPPMRPPIVPSPRHGRSMQDQTSHALKPKATGIAARSVGEATADSMRHRTTTVRSVGDATADSMRQRTTLATLLTGSTACPSSSPESKVSSDSLAGLAACAEKSVAADETEGEAKQPCPLPLAPVEAS